MKYDFNTVFDALLKLAEEHPDLSPEELLSRKAGEWDLDETLFSQISESNELLAAFDKKVEEMNENYANGKGREYFIDKELERITEGRSEQEKEAVSRAVQSVLGKDVQSNNNE